MAEKTLNVERMDHIINVFGSFDGNLKLIEDEMNVRITDRDSEIKITGDEENISYAERAINGLLTLAERGENIDLQ